MYIYIYVKMEDLERKYLHLRLLINDIKLNCYKINLLTTEAVRLKDKLEQIKSIIYIMYVLIGTEKCNKCDILKNLKIFSSNRFLD